MTELEKIAYAKTFIDKLANGVNPLDDTPIPEGDLTNNVRLSRCFFYVSDVLRRVIENGGTETSGKTQKKAKKKRFALSEEERERLQVSEVPLLVSEISGYLNTVVDTETTKRISTASIQNWLLASGLLETVTLPQGQHRKLPTAAGRDLGIFTEERAGQYGTYEVVLFREQAQQLIFDNLEGIITLKYEKMEERKREKKDELAEFHERPWTERHDERLMEMNREGVSLSKMAFALKRTEEGIQARLDFLNRPSRENDTEDGEGGE